MNHWLVKSEPDTYAWEKLVEDKKTTWDGVRNYTARNNLREMKKGDLVLFYHSNIGKEIVGIAKVHKEHFQDPTTEETAWLAVELAPFKALKKAVTLEQIKADKKLQNIGLVKQGRLSVMKLEPHEFDYILELSETK
jgi:predicted RNA-binding protein with PUA-like domain